LKPVQAPDQLPTGCVDASEQMAT
jgi:SAM-dependent methyltransferase